MGKYILEQGDTKLEDIKYGKKQYIISHGKELRREYTEIYCRDKDCTKQLIVKLLPCHAGKKEKYAPEQQYRLPTNNEQNNRTYCDQSCANRHKANKPPRRYKVTEKGGYPVNSWTTKQAYSYARRCVNP